MENQRITLLKKLLPGFIPLFVFIAVDEIWGTRAGLVAALAIGSVELIWIYIREKRFDRFVVFDTLLLMVLGGISIILDNDIFFKLKPGLIGLILCAILGLSAYSKLDIIGVMTRRYMKGTEIKEAQLVQLRKTLRLMFFVFLAHSALVFYAAFLMSDASWAFISGGLFYILFGVVFLFEFLKQRKQQKKILLEEQLPIVDESGKVIGKAPRSVCHNGEKLLHPVVHLHVLNKSKAIYLQKRPLNKLIQPGKWDTAVGGHVAFGEDIETSLKREAWEEIGLQNFSARFLTKYIWESEVEKELVYVFITHDFQSINLHSDEVEEGQFWTRGQIKKNMGNEVFTPNFEHEFKMLNL